MPQQRYEAELEINDFPQNARWKVTRRETFGSISDWSGATLGLISDWSGAVITTRGQSFIITF
ncbi:hypothetical protein DY000_02051060 [Brassica cretica]|uniref:Uncharacterized protein n=1 Tax=Brassica cretica TaxID=69181 RepID=A0ABQ7F7Y6_BRACR|nr:hypothetical protein DY000_02051060 [Brassica cretica]